MCKSPLLAVQPVQKHAPVYILHHECTCPLYALGIQMPAFQRTRPITVIRLYSTEVHNWNTVRLHHSR